MGPSRVNPWTLLRQRSGRTWAKREGRPLPKRSGLTKTPNCEQDIYQASLVTGAQSPELRALAGETRRVRADSVTQGAKKENEQ